MSSRDNRQLNLPPAPLTNGSRGGSKRTDRSEPDSAAIHETDGRTFRSLESDTRTDRSAAVALAAVLFDEALKTAKPKAIESKEVALILDVSESLVRRWRSPNYTEGPSFVQMCCLPASFHFALHKAQNKHFGFGRHVLLDAIDAFGLLAAAVGE